MKKPLIFGGGNHLKILSLVLFVAFLTLSCSAESTPKAEFSLTKVPDTVPTEDVWVIDSIAATAPITTDFNKLKAILTKAETAGRKIRLVFPNIVKIPASALNGIKSVVSVSAPLATTIVGSAFLNCKSLTTVSLPKAETIGESAFMDCSSLTTISLPLATTIENNAFKNCSALTTVSLPLATSIGENLITSAQEGVFMECDKLTTMTIATKSTSLTLYPTTFRAIDFDKITLTTSQGTKTQNNNWTVGTETFGPFKSIIGI